MSTWNINKILVDEPLSHFSDLMEKALQVPNQLVNGEMQKLSTLIPDMMHRMYPDERKKWLENFSNTQFLEFLMSSKLEAFGEVCRQAYKHGQLYRLLGQIALDATALKAIQIEIEAELQDSFRQSFLDKVFCRYPYLKIPLDQNRSTIFVRQDTRQKLDEVLCESILDAICRRMSHSCEKRLDVRNFAKKAVTRSLEASPGMAELKFVLAKSCRSKEQNVKKRLLNMIESTQKARSNFFNLAYKSHVALNESDLQESNNELNELEKWVETAESKGYDLTYVYDMVAVALSNEEAYESWMLSSYLKPLYQELMWMRVSVGLDAALRKDYKEQKADVQELEKCEDLLSERLTLSRLDQIREIVSRLKTRTITPSLIRQVLNEKPNLLDQQEIDPFQERLMRIQNPKDPNAVMALKELSLNLYNRLTERQKESRVVPSVASSFLAIYERTFVGPKL